jgi:Spy/CpxP family protein refolding chaperone
MTRLVVVIGFLVSLAAGLAIGLTTRAGVPKPEHKPPGERGSWLAQQLDLTPEQREQLDAIWSETARRGGREQWQQRSQLRRERDDAIAALIPEDRRESYQQLLDDFAARSEAMEAQWRESFHAAVQRTREILTPQQLTKYEELMSRHSPGSGPGGPEGGPDLGGRPGSRGGSSGRPGPGGPR